jgi:hypothetical protein
MLLIDQESNSMKHDFEVSITRGPLYTLPWSYMILNRVIKCLYGNGGTMENFMIGIYVIRRKSYINAKTIKIKTMGQRHIEETIRLANNGIAAMLSSHSRTPEGYQIFLQSDSDGGLICQQILDVLLRLPYERVVLERINC